jgi:hypothetical protein
MTLYNPPCCEPGADETRPSHAGYCDSIAIRRCARYQYVRKANGAKILTPGQIDGVGQPILAAAAFQAASSPVERNPGLHEQLFEHRAASKGGCSQDWLPHIV